MGISTVRKYIIEVFFIAFIGFMQLSSALMAHESFIDQQGEEESIETLPENSNEHAQRDDSKRLQALYTAVVQKREEAIIQKLKDVAYFSSIIIIPGSLGVLAGVVFGTLFPLTGHPGLDAISIFVPCCMAFLPFGVGIYIYVNGDRARISR